MNLGKEATVLQAGTESRRTACTKVIEGEDFAGGQARLKKKKARCADALWPENRLTYFNRSSIAARLLRNPRCGVSWPDLRHAMRLQTHAEPNRLLKIFPALRGTSTGQREVVDFAERGA